MSDVDRDPDGDPLSIVAGGAVGIFAGRTVKLGLLFLVEVLMARLLGVSSYGGIVLALMVVTVGSQVGDLGLGKGISRKVPRYEDEVKRARGVVRHSLFLGVASSCVTAATVFVTAPSLARVVFDSPGTTPLFRIAAVAIPFIVIGNMGVSIAKSVRDASTRIIVDQLTKPVLRAILVPGLIAAGFGAVGAMVGVALSMAVGAVVAISLAFRRLPFVVRGTTSPMAKEMVTFSVPLMLASGTMFVFHNTDTFLLGWFLRPDDVGIYNVAFNLQNLGMFFFYPVTYLLPPLLTRLQQKDKHLEMERTYKVATKWMTLPTFFVTLVVILFPETLIHVSFGPSYVEGATALRILMIAVFTTTILGANGSALVALGHNRINMYVNGGSALLNIALNLLLIPVLGILGAALATTTSSIVRDLVYSIALFEWHSIHPFSMAMVKPMMGMAPVMLAFATLLDATVGVSFVSVVSTSLVAAGIFAVLTVRLGAIESEDVQVFSRFEQSISVDMTQLRSIIKRIQT